MFESIHRLYCDNCKCYIKSWNNSKPNITTIRKFAKVVYTNGIPTILCNDCFNKLNNKQNDGN